MIEIMTLVKYQDLYDRMIESAVKTAVTPIRYSWAKDTGLPNLAATYNRLGEKSEADILVFCHDDIEFIEDGWDARLIEALCDYDVAGVCGTVDYRGGRLFDAGNDKCIGKLGGIVDGKEAVRSFGKVDGVAPAMAVDGCFMAVRVSHFAKCKFDETFDELFFYDIDYCLRSKCCVVDILVSHNKPDKYRGIYPSEMKPIGHYWDRFHQKHELKPQPPGDQTIKAFHLKEYVS